MIDAGTPAVGCGNALVDETLIERQVREWAVLGEPVVMTTRTCCAVISSAHLPRCSPGLGLAAPGRSGPQRTPVRAGDPR